MADLSNLTVEFVPGPPAVGLPRTAAEAQIREYHPHIKAGAPYALEQLAGRWIAAVVHEAAPPPFAGGGPADDDEEAPGPKSEGPDDAEPSAGGDSDSDGDSDSENKPPKPKGEGKKDSGEIHKLMAMLEAIAMALGVPLPGGPEDNMAPGMDDMGGAPGGLGGPAGPGALGGPGAVNPHADKDVVRHERVTKPGETPPGGTPIGAPAFASVREDHPWSKVAGTSPSFQATSKIYDRPLSEVKQELDQLAAEVGYRVSRLREATDEAGNRLAIAVITTH